MNDVTLAGPEAVAGPTIQELHLDFLLWEELQVNRPFLSQFIEACTGHSELKHLIDVRHSVSDRRGEADLIVRYRANSSETVGILIEDKIGAAFQPDQAKRYVERGEDGRPESWDRYVTCLVAPSRYIEQGHSFQRAVSLESLMGWLQAGEPTRQQFRVQILRSAIDQNKRRGPKQVDDAVTRFRVQYYEFLSRQAPQLSMNKPGPSGPQELWFRLKFHGLPKGAYIYHKASMGAVDLTFPGTDVQLLRELEPWLEFGMEIKQTAKSAAIRLSVPSIERFDDFEEEKEHVAIAVNAAMRLAVFGKRERERLDQALSLT